MCCKLDLLIGVQTALMVHWKNNIASALSPSEKAGAAGEGSGRACVQLPGLWAGHRSQLVVPEQKWVINREVVMLLWNRRGSSSAIQLLQGEEKGLENWHRVWLEFSCSRGSPGMCCPSLAMVKRVEFYSYHFGALWAVRNLARPGATPWPHLPFLVCFRKLRIETGVGSAEPACCEPWAGGGGGVPLSEVHTDDGVPLSGAHR